MTRRTKKRCECQQKTTPANSKVEERVGSGNSRQKAENKSGDGDRIFKERAAKAKEQQSSR
jgi:hypothetical protein